MFGIGLDSRYELILFEKRNCMNPVLIVLCCDGLHNYVEWLI